MYFLKNFFVCVCLSLVASLYCVPACSEQMFMDCNAGSGSQRPGWIWLDDANGYGQPGWQKDPMQDYGAGWYGPKSFNKGTDSTAWDASSRDLAEIDTSDRAPSTATGGSFRVYEPAGVNVNVKRASWWVWYDGEPLGDKGFADAETDRWEFYLKTDTPFTISEDGLSDSVSGANFHIGTYVCWNDGSPAYGTGDGCPYEGPGNQHYYHFLTVNPGAWINVQLDQHPNHRRDSCVQGTYNASTNTVYGNDPTFFESGQHYLEHLNQFYFEIRTIQDIQDTAYWLDEMKLYSSQDTLEPDQNDISISSPYVGYWPTGDYWEMGWHDLSFGSVQALAGSTCSHRNDTTHSTFEIRWSTGPITNENFNQANGVTPLFYGGVEHTGEAQLVRRPNSWGTMVWTRFALPDDIEQRYNRIYFAVKDVSVAGAHIGTRWPWNRGDGHDAPTTNIRIIDYSIRPDGSGLDAEFAADPTTVATGIGVQFTDTSTGGPDTWYWNFGDGHVSTLQHPEHIYRNAGTYTVSLTVANDTSGDTETKNKYIVATKSGFGGMMLLYMPAIQAGARNDAKLLQPAEERSHRSGKIISTVESK